MKKALNILILWAFSLVAWAQTVPALEQVKADPRKAYGMDFPYPETTCQLTKTPKGYKPFYISHYGRHGSRYYWNATLYRELDSLLTKAHARNQLTAEGKASNMQLIFYRGKQPQDILVKCLLNGCEVTLPLPADNYPYYKWADFKKFYTERCNSVTPEK